MGSLASGCSEIEGLAPSPGVEVITTRRIRFLIGLSGGPAAASIAGTVSSSFFTTVRMAWTVGISTNCELLAQSVSAIVSRCGVMEDGGPCHLQAKTRQESNIPIVSLPPPPPPGPAPKERPAEPSTEEIGGSAGSVSAPTPTSISTGTPMTADRFWLQCGTVFAISSWT